MAESGGKSGKSWLKYGCLGCLGVVAIVVLVVVIVAGVAMSRAKSMQLEEQVLTKDLPGVSPESLAADMPATAPPMPLVAQGRVVLELSQGDFHIEPAGRGEAARVEASFDPKAYELKESFEPGDPDGWIYTVSFRRTARSSLLTSLSELFSGKSPKIHIYLPRDVPMDLELDLSQGGSQIDLGGLTLGSGELTFTMGGIDLTFSEPLSQPAESLTINGSMGGASLRSLGNASPKRLDVDFSMGGMQLDLRGRWVQDARISIEHGMGGGMVQLPRDVIIEGLGEFGVDPGEVSDPNAPKLTFTSTSRMGDLQFDR